MAFNSNPSNLPADIMRIRQDKDQGSREELFPRSRAILSEAEKS